MQLMISRRFSPGFTIIELMIVMIVLGVLASLAAPAFNQLIRSQRVRTLALDLYGDLTFARSEAIKRNAAVTVTPKDTAGSGTKDWRLGWDIQSATNTLKSEQAASGDISAVGGASITFMGAGRPTSTIAVTIKNDDIQDSNWRCVSVDLSGRVTSKAGACS